MKTESNQSAKASVKDSAGITYKQAMNLTGFNEKTMEPDWVFKAKERSMSREPISHKSERLR